ncbi:MAG: hypothetical protein AMXMBFR19_09360 [Chthonomonadaceae bacterium]|uniref:Uncharacterized protein n=1 Tax=Candidatus Nitrosymbiomonas proteolyticus TaxID=2608984 RepID=A0A809RIP8_9BACT|nr:conserved hypothetical protein [Candidatus Nitrosymbiomonas proteolyticus]
MAVILSLLCASAQAKVATISLNALAKLSDLILVAEVERVELRAGVRVARIKTIQFVKGSAECPIAFVAERTWTCDLSTAIAGERVLLYLSSIGKVKGRTMNGQDLGAAQAACKKDGIQLYTLTHSGRGRIPLSLNKGQWVAGVTPGEGRGPGLNANLYVPKPIPTLQTSPGHKAVSLAELVRRSATVRNRQ